MIDQVASLLRKIYVAGTVVLGPEKREVGKPMHTGDLRTVEAHDNRIYDRI
jgi:hypothetical protein